MLLKKSAQLRFVLGRVRSDAARGSWAVLSALLPWSGHLLVSSLAPANWPLVVPNWKFYDIF